MPFCLLPVLKLEIRIIIISMRMSIIIGNISLNPINLLSYMCRPELNKVPLPKFWVKLDEIGAKIIQVWSCAEIYPTFNKNLWQQQEI